MRPLRHYAPLISVSRVEPSGDLFSWYSPSSSRSLGHSLLLGQRSRLNFFSHLVRSLFQQLAILADRRPRSLNEFAAQSWISTVSNRAASGSLSGGALGGHQPQKGRHLTNVFDLAPVPDTGHHLAG